MLVPAVRIRRPAEPAIWLAESMFLDVLFWPGAEFGGGVPDSQATMRSYGRTIAMAQRNPSTRGNMARQGSILCVASYEKGEAFLREVARSGCRVMLLTLDTLVNAPWPREILDEVFTMPDGLTYEQTQEYRYLPGAAVVTSIGLSRWMNLICSTWPPAGAHAYSGDGDIDDRTLSRQADHAVGGEAVGLPGAGVHVGPELRRSADVYVVGPSPWLLKPRAEASAIGIRKVHEPERCGARWMSWATGRATT